MNERIGPGDDRGSPAAALLWLLTGPLVWSAHLLLVYGPQAALCAFRLTGIAGIDPLLVRGLVLAVTVLAALALVLALRWPARAARTLRAGSFLEGDNGAFLIAVMRLLAVLSLAGVLWAGAVALPLPACPQLR